MSSNARTTKYLCCAYYCWYTKATCQKAFSRQFWRTRSFSRVFLVDLNRWKSMFWLERLSTYSKYRNDNLPDLKVKFEVFQRYSWMPNQVWNFSAWLSCQTWGLYIRIFLNNEFTLNWFNFYIKSVKYLFLFSIFDSLFEDHLEICIDMKIPMLDQIKPFILKLKGFLVVKVSKGAKIRNRYNKAPHPTQDTNGKVTNSQIDTTNESQEVSIFPAGDQKSQINRRAQRHNKYRTESSLIFCFSKHFFIFII